MDELDIKILNLLLHDGKMTHEEISSRLNLSRPAIHRRINNLMAEGVIKGYSVLLDWSELGFKIDTFILVDVKTHNFNVLIDRIMSLRDADYIIRNGYRVTGSSCILLRVAAKSTNDLTRLHDRMKEMDEVVDTNTMLVLQKIRRELIGIREENQ
ncbi:MAG: Lrp/AsnC family transcriptional regulator [Tissierellia bacterium]|nr:Lrp/AsnC family transcriptional regulator [Tissierellia bacterium]